MWARDLPDWSRLPSWPKQPKQSSLSIRNPSNLSVVRRFGHLAAYFSSIRLSSARCVSMTPTISRSKTGWGRPVSTARRILGRGNGHGNSVPRFHITWGTGPGILAPFVERVRLAADRGLVTFKFRHRVRGLTKSGGAVDGVRGDILEPSSAERGRKSSREVIGAFEFKAQAVIVSSGGIGANHDLVRSNWPKRLGAPPKRMICGVPDHVDGRMLAITEAAGGTIINRDRMWHYVEGVKNWNPIWTNHAIRVLAGPSSLWLDAAGRRLPAPLYPGFDTLATLQHLMQTGFD